MWKQQAELQSAGFMPHVLPTCRPTLSSSLQNIELLRLQAQRGRLGAHNFSQQQPQPPPQPSFTHVPQPQQPSPSPPPSPPPQAPHTRPQQGRNSALSSGLFPLFLGALWVCVC